MAFKVTVLLLSLYGFCVFAQNNNQNSNQDSTQQSAASQAQAQGRGRGNGNQNQQNANCLARCMSQGISASQRVVEQDFQSICGWYRPVAGCLGNCGGRQWDEIGKDLNDYCQNEDRKSDRFNSCYNRWLEPSSRTCSNRCTRGSNNWLRTSNLNTYCQNLHCYMPCMIQQLNNRCSQGGNAFGNVFYTPYVVMYESQFLYSFYVDALRQIPNSCGLFYVGNYLRSGDEPGDATIWDFNMPQSNGTQQA